MEKTKELGLRSTGNRLYAVLSVGAEDVLWNVVELPVWLRLEVVVVRRAARLLSCLNEQNIHNQLKIPTGI